jgi:hypothetical protein
MFSGGFLLSHNAVNESCYVAQFVNMYCDFIKSHHWTSYIQKLDMKSMMKWKTSIKLIDNKYKIIKSNKLC